jgi:hypothetical protein
MSPHTAPVTSATHFIFDSPAPPQSACEKIVSVFKFEQQQHSTTETNKENNKENKPFDKNRIHKSNNITVETAQHPEMMIELKEHPAKENEVKNEEEEEGVETTRINSPYKKSERDKYNVSPRTKMQRVPSKYSAQKVKTKQVNHQTMFPFDREAIDYDRIQKECFTVEDDTDSSEYDIDSPVYTRNFFDQVSLSHRRYPKTSPQSTKTDRPADVFKQYTSLCKSEWQEKRLSIQNQSEYSSNYEKTQSTTVEVHFVSKYDDSTNKFKQITPKSSTESLTSSCTNNSGSIRSSPPLPNLRINFFNEKASNENTLENCQNSTNTNMSPISNINVTANPLETAVCTQPRATIVVQQVRNKICLFQILYSLSVNFIEKFVTLLRLPRKPLFKNFRRDHEK